MVGGDEDYLNPVAIYLNEDGSTVFERCQIGKYERRLFAIGDFLNDKFVLCGGQGKDSVDKADCEVIDETETRTYNMSVNGRRHASSIKLNQSTIWIIGGSDSNSTTLNSTEFLTINGSSAGVDFAFTVIGHCMVQYKTDAILLIGGKQNGKSNSKKTWIIDPTNGFKLTIGPSLKKGRMFHSCGKMKDEYGNSVVIVAGGQSKDSVEFLNTTVIKEWVEGLQL